MFRELQLQKRTDIDKQFKDFRPMKIVMDRRTAGPVSIWILEGIRKDSPFILFNLPVSLFRDSPPHRDRKGCS
ncbi:protein of unknown function [Nitrospira japonica]|uniref:Uncharacterized protein n=1 Tax=Nitrospira japonica TaxID=1325564 RepID=A0A1W1I4T0_9BACT|nr:protein of unknown function [Nitrospira japonica]